MSRDRRVLALIALFLVASAALRLAEPAAAVAREIGDAGLLSAASTAEPDAIPEIVDLLARLRAREAALDAREAHLDARAEVLDTAESRVRTALQQLDDAEKKLAATMVRAQTASEDDLARLTGVYENMESEQAAELFKRMEPSFAAGFLGRMRTESAAGILAMLEPETAYAISVVLAGRHAGVPVEDRVARSPEDEAEAVTEN